MSKNVHTDLDPAAPSVPAPELVLDRQFFESLDRIDRVMHGTKDIAQVMHDALGESLAIFGCDRAYLLHPLDPDAKLFEIPMERTVPRYPSPYAPGVSIRIQPHVAYLFRTGLATDGPDELTIDTEVEPWKSSHVKSLLRITLHPNAGKPWEFGLQQCGYARRWTQREKRLFQQIGRRLAHGLTALFVHRALQRSEQLLDSIVETMPVASYVKDAATLQYLRINKVGEDLFRRPRARIVGRADQELFQPEEAAFSNQKDREALERRRPVDVMDEILHGDSHDPRTLRTRRVPLASEAGQPQHLLGLCEDITDQRRLEEQLRQAQRLASTGLLAGGIVHDLNNMLSVILGSVDMAYADGSATEAIRDHLDDIRYATQFSAALTRRLLKLPSEQATRPALLDLEGKLGRTTKLLQRLVGERISLEFVPAGDLWPVCIEASQVDQLVLNLCINARDAIAGAGSIVIETANVPRHCAGEGPSGAVGSDFVMLSVSDDGQGMDAETLRRCLEPFFTTKEKGMGTGLGLATVSKIVEENGGSLDVQSEPGHGTTIKLYLPRARSRTQPSPGAHIAAPAPRGSETVLLVEDEPSILAMIAKTLESLGYRVLSFDKPSDAVRAAERHPLLHVLITDVIMPEMHGATLASRVLTMHPSLKCLFMSGHVDEEVERQEALRGASFIHKPFSMTSLVQKLRTILG